MIYCQDGDVFKIVFSEVWEEKLWHMYSGFGYKMNNEDFADHLDWIFETELNVYWEEEFGDL